MSKSSRRDFLIGSAAGLALLTLPFGRRSLRAGSVSNKRNLIMIMAQGGWDVTFAPDPKPNLATVNTAPGQIQMFGDSPIYVDASRPNIADFFTRYGAMTAVVNGVQVQSVAHLQCRRRMLTGKRQTGSADLGAITAHNNGPELPVPYMIFGNTSFPGPLAGSSGRVGLTNQLKALLRPNEAYPAPPGSPAIGTRYIPDPEDETLIRQYVKARAERVRATRGQLGYNKARVEDFVKAMDRGDALKPHVDELGPRGVTLALAQQTLFAVDAIDSGISNSVLVEDPQSWDTHTNNDAQQGPLHNGLYGALTMLMDELSTRPGKESGNVMLDETVVVVLSEMTRTPLLNAGVGKDHWPSTSCLVMGAGVAGGKTYGGTDDTLNAQLVDMNSGQVSPSGQALLAENVLTAVLQLVGAESSQYTPQAEPLNALIA